MKLPRRWIAPLSRLTAERTGFAFDAILIRRSGDTVNAVATDGKRLLSLTRVDDGDNPRLDSGCQVLIDANGLVDAAKATAKAFSKRVAASQTVGIEESSLNGMAQVCAGEETTAFRATASCIDGSFPELEKFCEPGPAENYVEIVFDAYLLAETLKALGDACDPDKPFVRLFVPRKPTAPLYAVSNNAYDGTRGVACVMPVNTEES